MPKYSILCNRELHLKPFPLFFGGCGKPLSEPQPCSPFPASVSALAFRNEAVVWFASDLVKTCSGLGAFLGLILV